mgnify:CR=1 FL=1
MIPDVDPAQIVFQMLMTDYAQNPQMATNKIKSLPNGILEQVLLFTYRIDMETTKLQNYKRDITTQIEDIVMPLDSCIRTTFPITMEGHE